MKVQLIVTTPGPNQGKAIPIVGGKFSIGRDEGCNLRPASPMVSKLHCALIIREGKVFLQDFGSTNGTVVNNKTVQAEESQLNNGDQIKIGPLEFELKVMIPEKRSDSTPLPEALKKLDSGAAERLRQSVIGKTTAPASPSQSAQKPVTKSIAGPVSQDEDIDAAAMLLGLGDDDGEATPSVPEGSTVMEIPAINADGTPVNPPEEKKKKAPSGAEMSAAANDILRKYIRRTGG